MHFASPFDLLANSLWEIALPIPFAPRKRRSLRVGTHLASDKDATIGDFHDFLVSHCPNHRHSGSPYLVLRTFNPSALAIPEFFPPDLLDPCSNGAAVVVHQIRGRFLRAAKTTKFATTPAFPIQRARFALFSTDPEFRSTAFPPQKGLSEARAYGNDSPAGSQQTAPARLSGTQSRCSKTRHKPVPVTLYPWPP